MPKRLSVLDPSTSTPAQRAAQRYYVKNREAILAKARLRRDPDNAQRMAQERVALNHEATRAGRAEWLFLGPLGPCSGRTWRAKALEIWELF